MSQKKTQILATIILLLFTTLSSQCLADVKYGVGSLVNFSPGSFIGAISIPIRINHKFFLEPAIGIRRFKRDYEFQTGDQNNLADNEEYFSLGLYGVRKIKTNFELYYGAGIGANRYVGEFNSAFSGDKYTVKEVFFRPTLGVSFLLNPNFSIGIDLGLYIYNGSIEYRSNQAATEKTETSGITTDATIVLRYMF